MRTLAIKKMADYEIIDAKELAKRWKLPESWVRNRTRARTSREEQIPCVRLGRYIRFEWQHPSLVEWFERHRTYYQQKDGKLR